MDEVDEEEEEVEVVAAEVAARGRRTSCDVVNIAWGRSTADADERRGAGDVDVGAGGCGADAGARGETARVSAVDLARAKAEASLRVADIAAAGEEARAGVRGVGEGVATELMEGAVRRIIGYAY